MRLIGVLLAPALTQVSDLARQERLFYRFRRFHVRFLRPVAEAEYSVYQRRKVKRSRQAIGFWRNGRYRARTYDLSGVNRMLFRLS